MAYELKEISAGKWGVFRQGESEPRVSHDNELLATDQTEMLRLAEQSKGASLSEDEEKSVVEKCYDDYHYRPYSGATSFAEATAFQEARKAAASTERVTYLFQDLMANIMRDDEIADKESAMHNLVTEYTALLKQPFDERPNFLKSLFGGKKQDPYELVEEKRTGPAMKRVNNIDFPARDFAYVPDAGKPNTWRILLSTAPGKVTVDSLTRAASALNGQKSLVPVEALSSVKRRIRQEFRKLGVPDGKIPPVIKIDDATPRTGPAARAGKEMTDQNFFVFKDANDEYRWFAIYSNNYRDDDRPAEIISGISHETFTKSVERGLFPYPELWLWHTEEAAVGVADWLDYTGTLSLASGTFYAGMEGAAKNLAEYEEPLGVSHGMPVQYIVRDEHDPSVILFHVTKEISPLPVRAAANKLTGFVVLNKEHDDMGISKDRSAFLQRILPADLMQGLTAGVESAEGKAAESGREQKEVAQNEPETPAAPEYVTVEQFEEAMKEILQPMTDAIKTLGTHVKAQNAVIATLTQNMAAQEEKQALAPKASLASRVSASLNLGEPLADSDPLATSKPKEAPANTVVAGGSGLPLIDRLIERSRNGGLANGSHQ
jgi:hypothetical protein